ncbi:hypothetical protein BH09BAC6_BH09BAC6_00940 [soil metagenome]
MNTIINVKKLGLAFGLTSALLYLACMIVMATVGHANTVTFFNSLLHGLDVSSIIRSDVPLGEAGIGMVETFIIGWLIGACIGGLYNAFTVNRKQIL